MTLMLLPPLFCVEQQHKEQGSGGDRTGEGGKGGRIPGVVGFSCLPASLGPTRPPPPLAWLVGTGNPPSSLPVPGLRSTTSLPVAIPGPGPRVSQPRSCSVTLASVECTRPPPHRLSLSLPSSSTEVCITAVSLLRSSILTCLVVFVCITRTRRGRCNGWQWPP